MKNLRLIPYIHRQQKVIKVAFAYDLELIELIKSQKSDRWSQSVQSWYFPKKDFQLNRFYQSLKGKAFIDNSQLQKTSSTSGLRVSEVMNLKNKKFDNQYVKNK
ncbi:MAG: hypothetical protein P8M66_08835 [Flavobacteriaceae bacterium]|nr:hypothetical protein [Flavobacteriaceae bacterium]